MVSSKLKEAYVFFLANCILYYKLSKYAGSKLVDITHSSIDRLINICQARKSHPILLDNCFFFFSLLMGDSHVVNDSLKTTESNINMFSYSHGEDSI